MEFVRYLYEELKVELPIHIARKMIAVDGQKIPACKQEKFIFELLDYSRYSTVLVYPRGEIYAPLKNKEGEKSLETVRVALLHFNRNWLSAISGIEQADMEFELDPAFYYPDPVLIEKWRGRAASSDGYLS